MHLQEIDMRRHRPRRHGRGRHHRPGDAALPEPLGVSLYTAEDDRPLRDAAAYQTAEHHSVLHTALDARSRGHRREQIYSRREEKNYIIKL